MKKQILFLAMFTLALIFAGTNHAFGQTVIYKDYVEPISPKTLPDCAPALPLTCAGSTTLGHLTPTPGVTYTYEIATDPATVDAVHWFVTDQASVIDGTGTAPVLQAIRDADGGTGTYILDAENAPVYNTATNTQHTINISWKNFNGATTKVLLVAYIKGAAGCTDNVEVWRIQPKFTFTLDVLSMFDNGTLGTIANPASECVSPIESAVLNAAGDGLVMNYGQNYVFFSVNAAYFVGSWMPTIAVTSTSGTATAEWATPTEAAKTTGGVWNATTVAVPASPAAVGGVVGKDGECIVVRVKVVNAAAEAPVGDPASVANTITLTVNGIMFDPIANNYTNTTLRDMSEGAAVNDPCRNDQDDVATYKILARPNITEVTPTPAIGPFVPKI
jgi:hypothetical protein